METVVHGNLANEGLEVVKRDGRYYVRYDAGSHQMAWREDELSEEEFERLRGGGSGEYLIIIELQHRLQAIGEDPYTQNWSPPVA